MCSLVRDFCVCCLAFKDFSESSHFVYSCKLLYSQERALGILVVVTGCWY